MSTEITNTPRPTEADLSSLLQRAKAEIDNLRAVNQRLSDKMEMVELFQTVLFTKPEGRSQGYSEDISWLIARALKRMETP